MAVSAKVTHEEFSFGPWVIFAQKGPILKSAEVERITKELNIPAIPEMVFGESKLMITNKEHNFSLLFNAIDALRLVDNKNDVMKVAAAEEWQRTRADCGFKVANPYDWTYTTDYKGTLSDADHVNIIESKERIDLEKLKKREQIHFYSDLLLFEDELADNGIAKLNVKMRVMPSSFFILLRFFLRIDDVMIRINDTRIYHEAGSDFMIREFSSKEKKISQLKDPLAEESTLSEHLDLISEDIVKIKFEQSSNNNLER